jgi:hypothetical protein
MIQISPEFQGDQMNDSRCLLNSLARLLPRAQRLAFSFLIAFPAAAKRTTNPHKNLR